MLRYRYQKLVRPPLARVNIRDTSRNCVPQVYAPSFFTRVHLTEAEIDPDSIRTILNSISDSVSRYVIIRVIPIIIIIIIIFNIESS